MQYHYTYRITNIELKKHYYGCRTSKVEPKLDLGIIYFSSSTDKVFIKDQRENNQNYKYKIVKIFDTRKDAELFETILHEKFQVQIHESFYNKAKNTLMGFSVESRKQTEEHIKNRIRRGMVSAINITTNERVYVTSDEYQSDMNLTHHLSNWVFSESHNLKISIAKLGVKLSEKHKEAISNSGKEKYKDEEFYKKFCITMSEVNKRENKRTAAGSKIKEKWKDADYLEKMKNRKARSSDGTKMKDKWADSDWKENILNQRRLSFEKRKTIYNVYDSNDNLILENKGIIELRNIWNNLHKVQKSKPLGSTRQSYDKLKLKNRIDLIGYYSKEVISNEN